MRKEKTIEILESVKISQKDHDVILEAGDKILVLNEGACSFALSIKASSMEQGYKKAVAQAKREYGNDPYNGTISTTSGYKEVFPPTKNVDSSQFRSWGNDMIEAADKWDPAMGVDLGGGKYFFFGWASE